MPRKKRPRQRVRVWATIENEEVARIERKRGNNLFAMLLLHAAIEGLLSSVKGGHTRDEGFAQLIRPYEQDMRARKVPAVQIRRQIAALKSFNHLRNTVAHSWLPRHGFQKANRMLRRRRRTGFRLYLAVLHDLIERQGI